MPRFAKLSDWLAWLENLHSSAIDLGLDRVYHVAQKLQILSPRSVSSHSYSGSLNIPQTYVFMVAGTNGKGSCVATIEQCLAEQKRRQGSTACVGSYTSPHLHHYSERICIDGEPVSDSVICEAFTAIDQARQDISLTYFEFGTLAALWIFVQRQLPYVVLEVGLGGRLDAVNIVDADITIVTSVDVDHEEWLGCDRNQIAREKLGISRPTTPMIIAEEKLTPSLIDFSQHHDATSVLHHDFLIKEVKKDEAPMTWQWWPSNNAPALTLPMPELPLTSVVAGLQALYVANVLPSITQLQTVLLRLQLKGRYQQEIINGKKVIFDVAHNPAAAKALASKLSASLAPGQKTIAVFALMADKDKHAIIHALTDVIDCWYYASLADNPRSASTASMGLVLQPLVNRAIAFEQIEDAFVAALNESSEYDRIIVFGSFFTVTAIQQNWVNRTD